MEQKFWIKLLCWESLALNSKAWEVVDIDYKVVILIYFYWGIAHSCHFQVYQPHINQQRRCLQWSKMPVSTRLGSKCLNSSILSIWSAERDCLVYHFFMPNYVSNKKQNQNTKLEWNTPRWCYYAYDNDCTPNFKGYSLS